jgi:RluA family pseudouridine synthase
MKVDIRFEDDFYIAANKPSGLMVEPDRFSNPNLKDLVTQYVGKSCKIKTGVGVIHRLDRPVSGIVLFAKTPQALKLMNLLFEDRKIRKFYIAEVEGKLLNSSATLENFIYKDDKNKKAIIVKSESTHNKHCKLKYRVLKTLPFSSVIEIELFTGRFHQIRAQLSHIGNPILGDNKYGAKTQKENIHLHASKLIFVHPFTSQKTEITASVEFS